MSRDVDLTAALPEGLSMIEASAGTGKTYTLVALALRSIVEDDVPMSSLCLVTFTEAATAEMRGRLRSTLIRALGHLASDHDTHDDTVIEIIGRDKALRGVRAERVERAIAELDLAWITTIHGWCARVLATAGVWAGGSGTLVQHDHDVDEVVHDTVIARYAVSGALPASLSTVMGVVKARLAMPLSHLHVIDAEEPDATATKAVRTRWATAVERIRPHHELALLVDDIVAEVHRRRHEQRRQTFDSLLTDTRTLLTDPQQVEVVCSLRDRFDVVLIDEFQDTDQIQWDIFRRAFVEPLPTVSAPEVRRVVLVGDPKQSIYRFRSAELSAYLAARRHAPDHLYTLRTNWRSDPALLAAVEHLLTGATFGDDEVAFEPVQAPPDTSFTRLAGPVGAPLQFRIIDGVPTDTTSLKLAVRRDVTATTVGLLDGSVLLDDPHHPDGRRRLRPADIAILTRSNDEASAVALELSAAGVPAATSSSSSVLDSEAGRQWRVLLTALGHPARLATARAVATGWFVGASLTRLDDDALVTNDGDDVIEVLHRWSRALQRGGVPALMGAVGAAGWHQRVLGRVDGERHVTDVDHIAELLHAATGGRSVTPAALLERLDDLEAADDRRVTAELLARRIDRDDDAVQVMTIHRAKGLEFPVVLCPGLWTTTPNRRGPAHAVVNGRRLIDLISGFKPTPAQLALVTSTDLQALDRAERLGEERRLLYVALTRARHRCIVWWAEPHKGISELRTLVHERGGPHALAASSDGAVEAVVVTPDADAVGIAHTDPTEPPTHHAPVTVAVASRFHDRRWRIWSFSAIKSAAADDATAAPTGGGVDEVGTHLLDHGVDLSAGLAEATLLQSIPGGTRLGTTVHRILERVDFDHPRLHDHLLDVCETELAHARLGVTAEQLARALGDTLAMPLGGPGDLGPLRAVSRRDRLDELDFDLILGTAEVSSLGVVLLDHLERHDPARPWAQHLASGALDVPIDGRLTGSIDLVARHGPDQQVWVADYKTNRLGPTNGRDPGELHAIMAHSQYWLQAALYLTATHRYLRWRRPDYDPDLHLIGAAYLFLRGMDPNRPGSGVVWWRPTTAAIEAMDLWLRGQGAS